MDTVSGLAFASLGLTYLIRSAGAYLLLCLLCRLIASPQVRFRLCGFFLGGVSAAWIWLLLLPSLGILWPSKGTGVPVIQPGPWLLSINSAALLRFATALSYARGIY